LFYFVKQARGTRVLFAKSGQPDTIQLLEIF